jgi:hypothetical protein
VMIGIDMSSPADLLTPPRLTNHNMNAAPAVSFMDCNTFD